MTSGYYYSLGESPREKPPGFKGVAIVMLILLFAAFVAYLFAIL